MSVTWLFVPGSRPDRFDKAVASGADEVIVDLEDAVGPDAKDAARADVVAWLGGSGPGGGSAWVRVNAAGTPWHAADVEALAGPGAPSGLRGLVLPKAEDPDVVRRLAGLLDSRAGLVPLVESALGLVSALELARVPGVTRLAFGSIDYALDLGAEEDPDVLAHARSTLAVASRAAGLAPPVDGITADVRDHDLAAVDTRRAVRFGFGGKLCVHPAQVAVVRDAFAPPPEQLAWARGVLAAAEDVPPGEAFAHEGAMVDAPVLSRARALLARAPGGAA
ncbi:CoA ester lyase [Nocardioides sp. CFH 31398]|uniref:HpcH/HpaI aldolase/citrate lyase family protein n=1 Tax=Nocardioides sp. CFH 31398 TaxID=2919579 RepID=UPI001F060C93|nr:CoA ester lyase [Nocardioides sp. CFH 31398]MCH1866351.1 CoA ester lyase [Nocardioides sp. CFH 31398]